MSATKLAGKVVLGTGAAPIRDDNMKNNQNQKTNKPAGTQTPVSWRKEIEARAYEIWIASGGGHGSDFQHWLQAEAEILKVTGKDTISQSNKPQSINTHKEIPS
jgi:hypothetical protein